MKNSIFLSLDHKKPPKFHLVQKRYVNGVPRVSVTFPGGYTDTMVLENFYSNQVKKRMAEKEPEVNISSKDPCIICLEPRDGLYVLWPCGHTSLCEPCCINIFTSSAVTYLNKPKCPSCRKPITEYKQLFFQKPE